MQLRSEGDKTRRPRLIKRLFLLLLRTLLENPDWLI